ncbi:MAG: bifunctional phosphopantothenoylcysteine decarboxylase/phosphopantothenate--cysteine ligase CoaBC [Candidatus Margulisbacteria bacterium]|nr:bifunctional phosphopantothenoylcysteine decarboxylase/phosphopantothenate--cysteine ligase CoaBC [Candidatus Margulisiibacteriota bacterium]
MSVLLGICGSIAAYKTHELIRLLIKNHIPVHPVLTEDALNFVTRTSIGTLSGCKPYHSLYENEEGADHLRLTKETDILVIAPATAHTIAKCALGLCDNLLTTLFLAYRGPKLICPAMHTEMWENPTTMSHIQSLRQSGCHILGPITGDLACGDSGTGRMVDPTLIVEAIQCYLKDPLPLAQKSILISSGGTSEPIDPVRNISNASTGKLGHSMAHMAAFMGAKVTLVTTKPIVSNPLITSIKTVSTASDMQKTLQELIPSHDTLIMSAAVSDFTVAPSPQKLNRKSSHHLNLIQVPDILSSLSSHKSNKTYIGFSLADKNTQKIALEKLHSKNLDFIVSNTSDNIGSDIRNVDIYSQNGLKKNLVNQSVSDTAHEILQLIP